MSRSKQKGTAAESAVVSYLVDEGWPFCERRTLSGVNDKGDIAGIPGICIEVKDDKSFSFSQWLKEAHVERDNAGARHGFVWAHRPRKGHPKDWYVVMDGATLVALLKEAGY